MGRGAAGDAGCARVRAVLKEPVTDACQEQDQHEAFRAKVASEEEATSGYDELDHFRLLRVTPVTTTVVHSRTLMKRTSKKQDRSAEFG